jgi:post-segregation antitoxin (ccd killing protein)
LVTLELDSETIQAAEAKGLNLSMVLLEALYRRIPELHADERNEQGRRWLEQNREAIESMNRRAEGDALIFPGWRTHVLTTSK